jgi:hypothetical protein
LSQEGSGLRPELRAATSLIGELDFSLLFQDLDKPTE